MSAVHICSRSALTQAFRLSTSDAAASWTVSAFLVPACNRRSRRPFSSTRRRRAEVKHRTDPALDPVPDPTLDPFLSLDAARHSGLLSKPTRPSLAGRIPLPVQDERAHIEHWLHVFDPFLPHHLQRSHVNTADPSATSTPTAATDVAVTPTDLAYFLVAAQYYSHNILSHLALQEQRWDTVVWIAKKLVGDGSPSVHNLMKLEPFANAILPEQQNLSLDELTGAALRIKLARPPSTPSTASGYDMDDITSIPDTNDARQRLVKRALGQIWRTLGSTILLATEDTQSEYAMLMPRVLEILAHLHHLDLIPASVYAHKPELDNYALQQPPTLHVLSSKILTALSDAQWRAHEESVKVATERLNASYFLGHEIPGSRYKVQVTEVAPELWLELVLWSCVHGGWTLDGSAILEEIALYQGERPWGLTSWKELLQAEQEEQTHAHASQKGWGLFGKREQAVSETEQRARLQRKISSEVVAAIVDGLVNNVRLGVGVRGTTPELLVERIKTLKSLLDRNSLSLGSTTWDSIMSRMLESGSIVPEKRPEMLLSVLDLASGFGSEVSAVNASTKATSTEAKPPYFFEPSTVPISLLHRTMRSFLQNGDIAGAMNTLQRLQELTDQNKKKSLEDFFEILKSVPLREAEPFTSPLARIEFPSFETQLPVPLLAKLLDLVTDANMYDLGRWLLFSEELDGPLIRPETHRNFAMAAAVIRFGTMAGEHELVMKIVQMTSTSVAGKAPGEPVQHRMPHEFFTGLLCSQIKLHRWRSVQGMQDYVLESRSFQVKAQIVAQFGAELLRLRGRSESDQSAQREARTAFTNMMFGWEELILKNMRNELHCILGILSWIDGEWKGYCSRFLAFSAQHRIKLLTEDFNKLLSGVLDGYGSLKGREMVDKWCYRPPRTFEAYRAPGGLPTMAKFGVSKAEEYEAQPDKIEVKQKSGARVILWGRIHANRQTVWAVLGKVRDEFKELRGRGDEAAVAKRGELGETVKWAARLLYYLGFDYEDIVRDVGSLAELDEVEGPAAPKSRHRLWEDGAGL